MAMQVALRVVCGARSAASTKARWCRRKNQFAVDGKPP
jgi:hypothetical protein